MKTLNNYLLLYDGDCPICRASAAVVTKGGLIPADANTPYQQMPPQACPMVDRQRAANEIALLNTTTGEVTYGIASVLKIAGQAMPALKGLFNFGPFIWLAAKVYALFSYNRRVIVPTTPTPGSLQPAFKLKWRITYLLLTWLITALILTAYAPLLLGIVPVGGPYREYMICGGQIIFQGIIVALYARHKTWAYLGNMMTISCGGALLLLPMVVIGACFTPPAIIPLAYFLLTAGVMLLEHIRRSKLLALGWLLTITWVMYRLGVLCIIFLT